MARAHFVKKARKDNPVVKAEESYWWWSTRMTVGKRYVGTKHYSKTRPTRSQLTSSPFFSEMYRIEDQVLNGFTADDVSDVQNVIEEAVGDLGGLRDEVETNLDNMPEQLQESPTGELLQERCDGIDNMISELENIDLDEDRNLEDIAAGVNEVAYEGG